MKNKPRVKLLTFFRTGNFNVVTSSKSKAWLDKHFVRATDKTWMGNNLSIWRYGAVEFHFDGDRLFQIWCDNLDYIASTRRLTYDKWILTHPERLTFNYVAIHLRQEHIDYQIEELPRYGQKIILINRSFVRLFFENERMIAFHLQYPDS